MSELEPAAIGDMAHQAIEATLVRDEDKVLDILQAVLVDGTRRDGLAFVLACIFVISCGVSLGVRTSLGPLVILPDTQVASATETPLVPGQILFGAMLMCYLRGDGVLIRDLWLAAEDVDAARAVESALTSAAVLVRNQRAGLN